MGEGKEHGIPKMSCSDTEKLQQSVDRQAPSIHNTRKTDNDDAVLYKALCTKLGLQQLRGESPAFLAAKARVAAIASYNTTVLLLGEIGTGKEMFARAIRHLSPCARQPFVPVNCGAIRADLVKNELFGHERGAFTRALSRVYEVVMCSALTMLLGEPSPRVICHFSRKFNDFTHWKCYTIPEKCLRTKQLRKLLCGECSGRLNNLFTILLRL
jgi:transcriptional regulator of acetoin/glycerol metabolism